METTKKLLQSLPDVTLKTMFMHVLKDMVIDFKICPHMNIYSSKHVSKIKTLHTYEGLWRIFCHSMIDGMNVIHQSCHLRRCDGKKYSDHICYLFIFSRLLRITLTGRRGLLAEARHRYMLLCCPANPYHWQAAWVIIGWLLLASNTRY